MPSPEIAKHELFARLAQGQATGITVVTPNRRLAQVLRAEFDVFQAGKGLAVWEDADILPLESFVERCYEDALYSERGGELPTLLSGMQSRALWEKAIRGSRWNGALLDVPRTAASAQQAWQTAHAWRIAGAASSAPEKFDGTEDTRAFADWAGSYARRLAKEGCIDSPLLFDIAFKTRTTLLVAYAFDIVSPQTQDLFARFELLHCRPEKKQGRVVKASFASPREELESAARWARARLEEGVARAKPVRIGVVVPDLKLRRREVARVFRRVMGSALPFGLSIGEPLDNYPLVAFALNLLEFSQGEKPYEEVSRILRSPFLSGAEGEMAARARLDAKVRRHAEAEISLPKLIGLIDGCPALRRHLEKIFELKAEKQSPHDWAQHYTALLDAAGFPGERVPDSAEFQARARFNELLGEFARLSLVSSGFSSQEAIRQLRRLCAETLFQPEGVGAGMEDAGAPVHVLGLLESAGIEFDALWVSGLTDGAWPQRVHADPFLPVVLQQKAGIPAAFAEPSLALDRRRTEGWMGAADEVVFSWARREQDRALSPSPLIAQVPDGEVDAPLYESFRDIIFKNGKTETFTDEKAPLLANTSVRGGTRVLADQAACPFRAYARHRLGAEPLDAPEPGLDAMQRGQLLHALMAGIWGDLKSSSSLSSELRPTIERCAAAAVAGLGIEGKFAELEVRRLIRLAGEWLEVERGRPPFEVVRIEKKEALEIGGLTLNGRIDRMDRLADGTHAIIDYKTGSRVTPNDWMGERPNEPQLPLYVITANVGVSAVAFAKLKTGDMKFTGLSLRENEIPGVKPAKSWAGLMQYWRTELEKLASGYSHGDARVDPKKGLATCRNCDLQPLCRVHERLSALDVADDAGEGE